MIKVFHFVLLILLCSFTAQSQDYKRDYFPHWSDLDGNGLDTRQDALIRQSLAIKEVHYVSVNWKTSKVEIGLWVCPYTGEVVTEPQKLDADHIVPLKYAWEHGAEFWTKEERERFANDQENILIVRDFINSAKRDKPPHLWLPPNISYIADYVSKFNFICSKYNLSCETEKSNPATKYLAGFSKGIVP